MVPFFFKYQFDPVYHPYISFVAISLNLSLSFHLSLYLSISFSTSISYYVFHTLRVFLSFFLSFYLSICLLFSLFYINRYYGPVSVGLLRGRVICKVPFLDPIPSNPNYPQNSDGTEETNVQN